MHVCKPPGVQPPGTIWHCTGCRLQYQYGPVSVRELGGRVINLWVRVGRPFWTPYGKQNMPEREGRHAFTRCVCGHADLYHDIDTWEEPRPICCVEGCDCGAQWKQPQP